MKGYFCVVPFTEILTLGCFILVTYSSNGSSHVGERCILPRCAKNAYCDKNFICRCRQDFPVVVNPEECRRGIRYGYKCEYNIECKYYDKNSSCYSTNNTYRCTCDSGLSYDERRKLCIKVVVDNTRKIFTSIIIGISSFIGCIFVGCLVLKFCNRRCQQRGGTDFRESLRRSFRFRQSLRRSLDQPESVMENAQRPSAPIHSLNQANENEDPPPSYEEVTKQRVTEEKG